MSIDDATIWQQGLRNTGLNLLLQDSENNKGVILVPRDNGVLGCNASLLRDETQWPYGDCAEGAREWLDLFGQPGAASILMYQWIPNQTFMSLARNGGTSYGTLLDYAVNKPNDSTGDNVTAQILVSPEMWVSLPGGKIENSTVGFADAKIVEVRDLCDAELGGVYVIDRPVYPVGLTAANATSLPMLNGYCGDSIISILSTHQSTKNSTFLGIESSMPLPSPLVSTFTGLIESSYPALPPLYNPMTNVTVFAPYTEKYLNVLKYVGLTMRDIVNFRQVLPPMTFLYLNHFVPGSYCPGDFKNGLTLQTVAGGILGNNDSLYIKQDSIHENVLHIEVLFGDETGKKYDATYLGQACSATVYTLDSFLTPWMAPVINRKDAEIPYKYISYLPEISQQLELLHVERSCQDNQLITSQATSPGAAYSDSVSPGALVGIILGSFIIVILCIGGMWWGLKVYRKKKCRLNRNSQGRVISVLDHSSMADNAQMGGYPRNLKVNSCYGNLTATLLNEIVLSERDVSIDLDPITGDPIKLGQGKFGTVMRGKLLDAESVAIKCIYSDVVSHNRCEISMEKVDHHLKKDDLHALVGNMMSIQDIVSNERILHEIALLKSCHSQYVVSFIGVVFRAEEVWLVTELFPSGDLWHALGHSSKPTVTWYKGGIFIAMDILADLKYLHNKRVIHFDLKSSNILLRESRAVDWCSEVPQGYEVNFRAKISDVGLSRMLPISREYISSTKVGGTWNWCAPEVILCSKCTPAADMFSFGVVLWEICTGEIPARGRMRNVRVPLECPQEVANLISACIGSQNPEDRPTASDAFMALETLLQDLVSYKSLYSI